MGKLRVFAVLTTVAFLSIPSLTGCARMAVGRLCSASQPLARAIGYPRGYEIDAAGASASKRAGDHLDSPYFRQPDPFRMESAGSLVIIGGFKTYQQSTEWSCGPSCALMVLHHYGVKDWDELRIAAIMKSNLDVDGDNVAEKGVANEKGEYGTSTQGMVAFFKHLGWRVESSLERGTLKDGASFGDTATFSGWVQETLKKGTPVMVEWINWGGHWQVIIGYDSMGTRSFSDDVLILTDPYDTTDHCQDGYSIVSAERFYYMWFDAHYLPEGQATQQWLIATPR
jgi:hypothetical protein